VRAFIAHGRNDRVIGVEFAHRARKELSAGGLNVDYHESDGAHHIDPAQIPAATDWLAATLASRALS
jgi:phospholipase/carboxylesterase